MTRPTHYELRMYCRPRGSIGIFEWRTVTYEASTFDEAFNAASAAFEINASTGEPVKAPEPLPRAPWEY